MIRKWVLMYGIVYKKIGSKDFELSFYFHNYFFHRYHTRYPII
jgi:hypothetical protein